MANELVEHATFQNETYIPGTSYSIGNYSSNCPRVSRSFLVVTVFVLETMESVDDDDQMPFPCRQIEEPR